MISLFQQAGGSTPDPCSGGISLEQALAIIAGQAVPLERESIPLRQSNGHVLATPLVSRIESPRYDTAAMDGYALPANAAGPFRVRGASYPGRAWEGRLTPIDAVRIMTGACVPTGTVRVAPLELTVEAGGEVRITGPLGTKSHIRARASDFPAGAELLPAGRVLDARAILVAGAADVALLDVWRKPRVAIITSGDEIAAPGSARIAPDAIPDSLAVALEVFAGRWHGEARLTVRVRDDPEALREAVQSECLAADVIVVVGGASRGDRDYARSSLAALGLSLNFAGVAMKPGKPVWYGRIGSRHIIGLPGNPTAALTTARLFLAPLLCAIAGHGFSSALAWEQRRLTASADSSADRESFLCARREGADATVLERQSASAQYMLGQTDLLVRLAPSQHVRAGEVAACLTL